MVSAKSRCGSGRMAGIKAPLAFMPAHLRVLVIVQSARRMSLSSIENPRGSMRPSAQPVSAAKRMTLPVLGGISGSTRTIENMA